MDILICLVYVTMLLLIYGMNSFFVYSKSPKKNLGSMGTILVNKASPKEKNPKPFKHPKGLT